MGYGMDRGMGYANSPNERTLGDIAEEVLRARDKFPGNSLLTVALGEEYGELCKAQLRGRPKKEIVQEAIQVAALAIRIIEEGDATMRNLSPEQKKA